MSKLECLFSYHKYEWYNKPEYQKFGWFTINWTNKILRCIQCGRLEYPNLKANCFPEGKINVRN